MRQKTDRVRGGRLAQMRDATVWPIGRGAKLNPLAAAVAGILYCAGGAYAADEQAPAAASTSSNSLEEVVVTASAQGVRKLDASFNIVTANLEEIQNANPASAAEIYKMSPGIWPETLAY